MPKIGKSNSQNQVIWLMGPTSELPSIIGTSGPEVITRMLNNPN